MSINTMGTDMRTSSDERMVKLKAAIALCRDGDLAALVDCHVTPGELITVGAIAKATGDTFTYDLVQHLFDRMYPGQAR